MNRNKLDAQKTTYIRWLKTFEMLQELNRIFFMSELILNYLSRNMRY